MLRYWISLLAGMVLPGFFSQLPQNLTVLLGAYCLLIIGCIVSRKKPYIHLCARLCLCLLVGFSWGLYRAHQLLDNQLPKTLVGEDTWVTGHISSLIGATNKRTRFTVNVLRAANTFDFSTLIEPFPSKVQVSWYRPPSWIAQLDPGDKITLKLRLKRPRGFVNPGGFDYQLWQLRRGVGAVGYVRQDANNQRAKLGHENHLRGQLSQTLKQSSRAHSDLMQALLLGNRADISADKWQILQKTGTNHLIAISGLHIGMVAGFSYLLGLLLGRCLGLLIEIRAHNVGLVLAACCAISYSALAGFSLPTQRALIMLLLLQWTFWKGKPCSATHIYCSALLWVVVLDPLSLFDVGFWLSFGAVGALLIALGGRLNMPTGLWQRFGRAQWVVFLALFCPLLIIYQQVSLVAPLVNIVAIPIVSFCVLPSLLLATVVNVVWPPLAEWCLWVTEQGLVFLWWWLEVFTKSDTALFPLDLSFGAPLSASITGLALLVAVCFLLPNFFAVRALSVMGLVLILVLPKAKSPPLALTILDVGQGLAIVVRAENKTLVYDAGPFYSEKFEAGAGIIAPYLKRLGVTQIDTLIVSHAHNDHSGGVTGLLKQIPVAKIYLGEALQNVSVLKNVPTFDCVKAKSWRWHNVQFTLLSTPTRFWSGGNNASCVLQISYEGHNILLTGDIERDMEQYLVNERLLMPNSYELLVAPHHGSKTSSTAAFVAAVSPAHVVFSSGYRNRHGHPHARVVSRYLNVGSRLYNTAVDGAIHFTWDNKESVNIVSERIDFKRFWYEIND